MSKYSVIETIEMDCPICDKYHPVEKRSRSTFYLIKGIPVQFDECYFACPESCFEEENEFVSAELMDENLKRARDTYNKNYKE